MKPITASILVTALLAGCAATPEPTVTAAAAPAGAREMKMAFDLTDGGTDPLIRKLDAIETTRKQLIEAGITPKIVLAFRGGATYYTQLDLSKVKEADRADALKIRAKLRDLAKSPGIESLEQCNIPVQQLKIMRSDLLPEVKLVNNGWISLVAYQEKGYGYIAP